MFEKQIFFDIGSSAKSRTYRDSVSAVHEVNTAEFRHLESLIDQRKGSR